MLRSYDRWHVKGKEGEGGWGKHGGGRGDTLSGETFRRNKEKSGSRSTVRQSKRPKVYSHERDEPASNTNRN